MIYNGSDCSIVIKTQYREMAVPYATETLRERVSLLVEEGPIEGDGFCKALSWPCGVTGCVVTPLTIGTAPLLLSLALGHASPPVYVSETRNLYRYPLSLLPVEDSIGFVIVQKRGELQKVYEGCGVTGLELRCNRGETGQQEAVHLKLDIRGDCPPAVYLYDDVLIPETGERFMGDCVSYRINGQDYTNIYGITLAVKKEGGTKTELFIKRALQQGYDLPETIDELIITAQLLRDKYEERHYGMFRLTLTGLVLAADETAIESADAVIGPLRYYCAGSFTAAVFSNDNEALA
jgi:hypothetical protein